MAIVKKINKAAKRDKPSPVSFVGAGPGDPELITVKGRRLLGRADIVVYTGSLINEGVLKYCRRGAKLYNSASMDISEISSIVVGGARAGKNVVRLHTGDPSLYSAIGEQTGVLDKEGVPYEVIPGVSSAFAAAAALKKELTVPEATQTVIFTRLQGRTRVPKAEGLKRLASHNATICVFLSAGMIEKVVRELRGGGYPASTPAAVVYRASWGDEVKITGSLKDIGRKVRAEGITRHAVIIAGRAVGEKAQEGARSKLYDRCFTHAFRK